MVFKPELMMKNFLILLAVIAFSTAVFSQSKVGTTAANFLTIPVGPRATGMGGAFVAVADDATTAFWNPGGISRIPRTELAITHAEWLVDTDLNWIGLVFKMDENNAIALAINQLDYGQEEVTTHLAQDGTGAFWKAQDLSIALSYGRNLTDRFSIGLTAKFITQTIWNESASAWALDVGLLFFTPLEGLRLGMNISNFGTEMKLDGDDLLLPADIDPTNTGNNSNISSKLATESWPLPLQFSVGLGYDVFASEQWRWVLAADALVPNNQTTYGNVGTELMLNRIVSLRVGYTSLLKEDAQEGLTAGVGLQYDFGGFFAKIDYSYTDFGIFDEISRFSLSVGL
jgi:hypothetical protein